MKKVLQFAAFVLIATPALAQSGADVLMDELSGHAPAKTGKAAAAPARAGNSYQVMTYHQPADTFQEQFLVMVRSQDDLPFDVRQWAQTLLSGDYTGAAHLWTSLQSQFPEKFRVTAEAANVYLLWKLGLHQTFIDQWLKNMSIPEYAGSPAEKAFELVLEPGFDSWLLDSAVLINPQQKNVIARISSNKPMFSTLKAWASFRNAGEAEAILPNLDPKNRLTRLAAQTAAFGHVKRGDLKGAAKILKGYMEPAIEASQDPELLSMHDVTIARILYQAGQMKAAAEFYRKVPNKSRSFLAAQEELSWVNLRLGRVPELRGELKALSSPVFKDRFQPEVYLVRSVSDLKMCLYDLVDKDLKDFQSANVVWAKRIETALNKETPPPPRPDEYTQLSARTVSNLAAEQRQLSDLSSKSIGAVLPAVGPQRHWQDDLAELKVVSEEANKRLTDEYRRQWKNMRGTLEEAIRKMRFVKVEYLSQVRQFAGDGAMDSKKLVASNEKGSAVVESDSEHTMNFPVETEIWPDEFFKLRSAAQTLCLKRSLK